MVRTLYVNGTWSFSPWRTAAAAAAEATPLLRRVPFPSHRRPDETASSELLQPRHPSIGPFDYRLYYNTMLISRGRSRRYRLIKAPSLNAWKARRYAGARVLWTPCRPTLRLYAQSNEEEQQPCRDETHRRSERLLVMRSTKHYSVCDTTLPSISRVVIKGSVVILTPVLAW